jgi:hypothetical protein
MSKAQLTRLKKVEDDLLASRPRPLVVVPVEWLDTPECVQAAYCAEHNVEADSCDWIFTRKFQGMPIPEMPKREFLFLDREAEIEQLLSELQQEGYTVQDIAQAIQEEKAVKPSRIDNPDEDTPPLEVGESQASDLVRLMRGKQ